MNLGKWESWKNRLNETTAVYVTLWREDESLSNVYESMEAAQVEVEFYRFHRQKEPIIKKVHVHTLELAREWWLVPEKKGPFSPRTIAAIEATARQGLELLKLVDGITAKRDDRIRELRAVLARIYDGSNDPFIKCMAQVELAKKD